MFRNIALATALLACAAGAGSMAAQISAPAKSAPSTRKTSSAAAMTATSDTTHHMKWTKAQIEVAQTELAKGGYYKGKPNGQMDADTRKALKAYQKANNLPATGRLSDSVLVKLKSV